ncbi:carboxymuconolactone decarboxylase family protein [Fangia hongkongensis]|uniref:carboxymuconolactone decarboxylase family protein n=1 Tax=Fangia hongkongensis TaxID=270495 RepID=UPI00036FF03F|nr:carboxymuconolactone decarboxylase family protein [Fangia hongkongensis]MBK2125158.1 carboxymuconolactone decarboxylase family protein [Fangia hongkongensis]
MEYYKISKNTMNYLYKSHGSLKDSPLDQTIRTLVELRVSQINGCTYCIEMHMEEAIKCGISENKLIALPRSMDSNEFNDKERVSLKFCELLTHHMQIHKARAYCQEIKEYYTDREIVDLTICISLMNAFNRIAISLR